MITLYWDFLAVPGFVTIFSQTSGSHFVECSKIPTAGSTSSCFPVLYKCLSLKTCHGRTYSSIMSLDSEDFL